MALEKRGKYYYGDSKADVRHEMTRFSRLNEYECHHFAEVVCFYGNNLFTLYVDEDEGAGVRVCSSCADEHAIGDSGDYLADAELQRCECICDNRNFELTVGVSLYADSDDVRWLYLGCRCPQCGLLGVYGNWKNEFIGYRELLARV